MCHFSAVSTFTFEDKGTVNLVCELLEQASIPFMIESIDLEDGNLNRRGYRIAVPEDQNDRARALIDNVIDSPFTTRRTKGFRFSKAS